MGTSFFPKPAPPRITKLGTIDCDMVETTPVVFHGRLYRFEYVRDSYYKPNTTGRAYFRFMDVAGGKPTSPFAWDHHLGSAFVNDGTMYVFGVDKWGGECVQVYWSEDLETWDTQPGIQLSGWNCLTTASARQTTATSWLWRLAPRLKKPASHSRCGSLNPIISATGD